MLYILYYVEIVLLSLYSTVTVTLATTSCKMPDIARVNYWSVYNSCKTACSDLIYTFDVYPRKILSLTNIRLYGLHGQNNLFSRSSKYKTVRFQRVPYSKALL